MYRVVVRYGYWDALIEHKNFEALLIESLEGAIKLNARNKRLELESTTNGQRRSELVVIDGNGSESEEVISEAPLMMVVSSATEQRYSENDDDDDEAVVEELAFIRRAREEGVTYLLGNSVVEASKDSSLLKKIIVDGIYHGLQLIARRSRAALEIPHKRLMEVGITYTI
jgi:KUP system potassium uptake protein